jgi:hypothetical protein
MAWYIRYLQKVIEKRDGGDGSGADDTLRTQRQRLISIQADREQIALDKDRGSLIPIEVFEKEMTNHITSARHKLLMLPANIAHQLEGESRAVIKTRLEDSIKNVLSTMSEDNDNQS